MRFEFFDNIGGDLVKVFGGQAQNCWASTTQTNSQEAIVALWGEFGQNLGEARYQHLPVRLMQGILHGVIDGIRVWFEVTDGGGQDCQTLKIENDVFLFVGVW